MSALPVRYTNHHHVASTKTTAGPVVVAVNKAAVAGGVQSAYHRHQQQMQHHQQHRHHHTPPVKRHPTKMAAARRAKSRSRTRPGAANPANSASANSPAKRRVGKAAAKQRKMPPQLAVPKPEQQDTQGLTAQHMVLDVPAIEAGAAGAAAAAAGEEKTVAVAEMDTVPSVEGDALRTPDAAEEGETTQNAGAEDEQQQQLQRELEQPQMDTSEAMEEEDEAAAASPAMTSVSTMTAEVDATPQAAPAPRRSNEELFAELQEALALEPKYQPALFLPHSSQDGEITIGARDGAAHVLRCLKVWYELPTDVLFAAINLVDRFLAKMKVRPKHLACISVGSLYLAAEQLLGSKMNTEDLALISQCRCTAGDLERMAGIIANKLGVQPGTAPVSALSFIRLFYHLFRNAAHELGLHEFYERCISLTELEQRLEVLACDATCSSIRASELALVLICTQMDSHASGGGVVNQQISGLVDYAIEVQKLARIPDQTFFQSHAAVVAILARYNSSQHKMPYKQRLVWKLSSRTMRVLRPSNKMTSYLPTIDEHNQASFDSLSRFRTGSLSSEDDEDWPTSPVVPIYEELC